ncbi:glucan biosynthesis protein [Luteolibacter pohnpeiensis]|uniref:Glucans biosynthesis protein G n=1 Tax=Luteolibacter pohnpeiensis TaxID=454153 RepID=A0A934SDF0_9BACT|nr:glucan biosynthesis protein [Luteolibacter pohnpeiensis]MBK1883839.1 glucan biosynthesis protein [Luteolibacter pohnpeiensis]
MPRNLFLISTIALFSGSAFAQTWQREEINFESIESRALDLSNKPYVAPDKNSLPDWMNKLTYDQYRDIRFNPDQALWAAEKLPFRAHFFHPGYLFREPVMLNEFTDTHTQRIRLSEAFFNYGPLIKNHGDLPSDGGFAGWRLHAPLNSKDYYDEVAVFQGASYWRALGRGQRYGISARGIAVNTGADGVTEEFPSFREFWLKKPEPNDTTATFYALLDGPSYSGAYSFRVDPGDDTVVNVKAVLFARHEVKRLGIAPMSSMFWFGENSRRRFDDFRPEVHDSDGLSIRMSTGERLWRPITNDSGNLEFSFFKMDKCEGFGLLQRDRNFHSYEDGEAAYNLRPSLWIEPTSDWGPGSVMLMEIPTTNELSDNTVAMWQPDKTPKAGDRIEFSYKQHWTMAADPSQAGGRVIATRTGVHEWQPEQRTMIVEFAGGALEMPDEKPPTAEVQALGDNADKIKIQGVTVQPLPEGHWRAAFQIAPADENGKLSDIGPVELRCALKRGDAFLTETWAYRIKP